MNVQCNCTIRDPFMKKIYFFGCSVSAGNELYEEKFVTGYSSMSFKEARNSRKDLNDDEVRNYNLENSFPALTAKKLGCNFENNGIEGISNKEIAARAFTSFQQDSYTDTVVILQFTTHNRVFIKYKEEDSKKTVGSFVIHPLAGEDERLTLRQNNLLKETYFEFADDSFESLQDHIALYYAADYLSSKGIEVYIIWPDRNLIQWADWEHSDIDKQGKFINDKEPQFMNKIGNHFVSRVKDYDILENPIKDILPFENYQLPRYHYTKEAHEFLAEELAKRLA